MILFSVRTNWAAIAGSVKILGGPILIWMDFNTWKRERAREIGTDNRKRQTRKMIVFRLERSCRIYDIFERHDSYMDGFQYGNKWRKMETEVPWGSKNVFINISWKKEKA